MMRQQVFEFFKAPAQKLPITLEDAIRQELLGRMADIVLTVWKAGRRSGDERSSGKH